MCLTKHYTSVLVGNEWSASRPVHSTLKEIAIVTHRIGGWLGPRSGLDDVERARSCPYWNFPQPVTIPTVQSWLTDNKSSNF